MKLLTLSLAVFYTALAVFLAGVASAMMHSGSRNDW